LTLFPVVLGFAVLVAITVAGKLFGCRRSELTQFSLISFGYYRPFNTMISKREEKPKVATEGDDDEPDEW
jgi:hypothetical protein